VTVNLYDDEHEEYIDERMTIAECLDRFTDEGCPTESKPKFYKDGLSCKGCKNDGQFEDEFEYGYPCPCIRCKRRARDNYEYFVHISEITEEEAVKIWKRIKKEDK
jgi:hypothetical protein